MSFSTAGLTIDTNDIEWPGSLVDCTDIPNDGLR
jgi:hypothetical protein